jgi:hypothetical protein
VIATGADGRKVRLEQVAFRHAVTILTASASGQL